MVKNLPVMQDRRRQWHPTLVLLPGKSYERRSLVGCSPWGRGVWHDWATSLPLFIFMHWRRKWQPTPVFLPGESQGREPGRLLSMGSHRVRHYWSDLAAAAMQDTWVQSLGWKDPLKKGIGYPLQYSCLENSMNRGAWWATVHRVAKSQTQLSE